MSEACPRLIDPLVAFDCKVISTIRTRSHYIVRGEVQSVFIADYGRPLILAGRAYDSVTHPCIPS